MFCSGIECLFEKQKDLYNSILTLFWLKPALLQRRLKAQVRFRVVILPTNPFGGFGNYGSNSSYCRAHLIWEALCHTTCPKAVPPSLLVFQGICNAQPAWSRSSVQKAAHKKGLVGQISLREAPRCLCNATLY